MYIQCSFLSKFTLSLYGFCKVIYIYWYGTRSTNLSFVKSLTIKHCMSIHILNNTSMVILSDYDGITSTFKIVFHQVSH